MKKIILVCMQKLHKITVLKITLVINMQQCAVCTNNKFSGGIEFDGKIFCSPNCKQKYCGTCKICGSQWKSSCRCSRVEKTCPNDHSWFCCETHNMISNVTVVEGRRRSCNTICDCVQIVTN